MTRISRVDLYQVWVQRVVIIPKDKWEDCPDLDAQTVLFEQAAEAQEPAEIILERDLLDVVEFEEV